MLRAFSLLLFCLLVVFSSFAQPSSSRETIRVGFIGDYASNKYEADFLDLPICPVCTHPNFQGDISSGFRTGVFMRLPLADRFSIDLALTYSDQSGGLSYAQSNTIPLTNGTVVKLADGVLRTDINTKITTFDIEPRVNYRLLRSVRVSAGVGFGFVIESTYDKKQNIIVSKEYDAWPDPPRTKIISSGDIPDMRKIAPSLSFGIGYDFSFGSIHPLLVTPELAYSFGLTNVVPGIDWKINVLRAGVSVSFPVGGDAIQ